MATLSVFPLIAAGCSQTENKDPVVVVKTVAPVLPPESRKTTPALTPKPDRALTQEEIFDRWSSDRTARNVGEWRRAACVAAVDAVK
ncbi:hypothetical protein [Rhizobium sp. GCM10022189]|uniref:hypothetical protein n=1 Tax=Rhizobium sp. GCM10022189 TaxID=3252654 RepID=UPI0036136532